MVVLSFTRPGSDAGQEEAVLARDVEELNHFTNVDETTTELDFNGYCFDEDIIVQAVIDLFRRAFQNGRLLVSLKLENCTGRIDEILHAATSLDWFYEIEIVGGSGDLSQHGFSSISAAMKFNKSFDHLTLSTMELTRQQAAALGAGLITTSNSQHFKELYMREVTFADGAIGELAAGLKQNSSLCILTVHKGQLEDAELAELIGAVESHPSLKELSFLANNGHEHALVALGKMLASAICRVEDLNFSMQASYDYDDEGLGGHLGKLAQGLRCNESLTCLNLCLNNLLDKDMDDLGQILALPTCKLETLNLMGNEFTHNGFVSLTQNIPGSMKSFDLSENPRFDKEEAACHTLTLFEENPQLCDDGLNWEESMIPKHQKIQHFKDLNRCGRILLPRGAIPLSVWPIVLARANTLLSDSKERATNAIFHLLQGPALMDRRFDRD
jgi:hypothetical protein